MDELPLACLHAPAAAVVVWEAFGVEPWRVDKSSGQNLLDHGLRRIWRLTPPGFRAARGPVAPCAFIAMDLGVIHAEIDSRVVGVAVVLKPTAQWLALQHTRTRIDARIAKKLHVSEHLPRRTPLCDRRDDAAHRTRPFVQEAVEISVLDEGVGEQQRHDFCAMALSHLPRSPP